MSAGQGSGAAASPSLGKRPSVASRVVKAIKSSPRMVRKAIQKLRAGGPGMKGCQENGWLFKDEDIKVGVTYKVQYLGSVEVAFDQTDQAANQKASETAMRALRDFNKEQRTELPTMGLRISMKNIALFAGDGSQVVMRHSTTRVAYSTVDAEHPKTFAYVAVVKGTNLALCHVFNTKSKKQGYEMTFACAQAFDLNLQYWSTHKAEALAEAEKSEKTDIQPPEAWQRKKDDVPHHLVVPSRDESNESISELASSSGGLNYNGGAASSSQASARQPISKSESSSSVFFSAHGADDVVAMAGKYFESLGINMIEAEDDWQAPDDDEFTALARQRSSLLTGVAADAWEGENVGVDDDSGGDGAGYMTVGTDFNFADDAF